METDEQAKEAEQEQSLPRAPPVQRVSGKYAFGHGIETPVGVLKLGLVFSVPRNDVQLAVTRVGMHGMNTTVLDFVGPWADLEWLHKSLETAIAHSDEKRAAEQEKYVQAAVSQLMDLAVVGAAAQPKEVQPPIWSAIYRKDDLAHGLFRYILRVDYLAAQGETVHLVWSRTGRTDGSTTVMELVCQNWDQIRWLCSCLEAAIKLRDERGG